MTTSTRLWPRWWRRRFTPSRPSDIVG
jgi:hypothetical protein